MTFGLTPQGFNTPRLADVKQILEDDFIAAFGDVNTDPQSVTGQLIGIFSKTYADLWENLEDVYFSQYPNSASGVSLDNVVQLNGITRKPETQTSVVATCAGFEGTYIPINSLASIPSTNDTFYAVTGGTITQNNADIVKVQVGTLTTQPYTIVLNNSSYTYSRPVITFSNTGPIFISTSVINITINNVPMSAIPYNTSSNQTLTDIASAIQALDSGSLCITSVTNPDTITITALSGETVTINSINVTGVGTQPTNAITFLAPANNNALTSGLTAIINEIPQSFTAVDNMDGTLTINANVVSIPFSCAVGLNLSVIYRASPITFNEQNYGPIPLSYKYINKYRYSNCWMANHYEFDSG